MQDDALTLPPITVMDVRTGNISDLGHDDARGQISRGDVIETVPSDPHRAKLWIAELRREVMIEATRRGFASDIPAFEEYEAWCAGRNVHALPVRTGDLVLFLLGMAASGVLKHVQSERARSIDRIHSMTNHLPRHLSRHGMDNYSRAIKFAKAELRDVPLAEVEERAARKALEMFPDGVVPLR